ncbi:hypothetical protein ACIOHS_26845 [Streptomyces sp. NPDC088253]|uniref:hypothetical protein n=1 Tax=Streptomyces sp. NPDC088253 TaxID=3365846 RepID=UPI0037F56E5C
MINEKITSGHSCAPDACPLPIHVPAQTVDRERPFSSLGLPECRRFGWVANGVLYRFYDAARQPLYIGQTSSLPGRLDEHRLTAEWWPLVEYVAISFYGSYGSARQPEKAAIRREQPRFNRQYRNGQKLLELNLHGAARDAAALLVQRAEPQFVRELAEALQSPEDFLKDVPAAPWPDEAL